MPNLTVREILSQLPEPHRSLAIANTNEDLLNSRENTITIPELVLASSFVWGRTEQGHDYWNDVAKELHTIQEFHLFHREQE